MALALTLLAVAVGTAGAFRSHSRNSALRKLLSSTDLWPRNRCTLRPTTDQTAEYKAHVPRSYVRKMAILSLTCVPLEYIWMFALVKEHAEIAKLTFVMSSHVLGPTKSTF